jgi:hypothetical protein
MACSGRLLSPVVSKNSIGVLAGLIRTAWKGAQIRSRGERVLVNQTAKSIAPLNTSAVHSDTTGPVGRGGVRAKAR